MCTFQVIVIYWLFEVLNVVYYKLYDRLLNQEYGYSIRIHSFPSLYQLFETGKYYTWLIRKWIRMTKILFIMNTKKGDSIIGYGAVEKIEGYYNIMDEDEYDFCKKNKYNMCITFKKITKFNPPLLIKDTVLRSDRRKGAFLHGAKLGWKMIDDILDQAEYPELNGDDN